MMAKNSVKPRAGGEDLGESEGASRLTCGFWRRNDGWALLFTVRFTKHSSTMSIMQGRERDFSATQSFSHGS